MRHDGAPARRWPYVLLRGTATTEAVLAVAQSVLAGGFLSGYYDALTAHMTVGITMVAIAVVQVGVAVILRRTGGPPRVLRMTLDLPPVLAAQAVLGVFHLLLLHVPFGVLMVIGTTRFAAWAWRIPLPGRAGSDGPGSDGPGSGGAGSEHAGSEPDHAEPGPAHAAAGRVRAAQAGPAEALS